VILGEFFEGKDYLSAAASHFTARKAEVIDPLYQYLDLQTLIEKLSVRLAETYSVQSVMFRASDFPVCVEHQSCGLCVDPSELSLPMEFQSQTLGTLTVRRGDQFSNRESQALASEALALCGPCNNALLYSRACYSACHDELTGLFNRSVLKTPLLSSTAFTRHEPLVLLVCDIDHFKLINDNHGHAVGDAVLRRFSAQLQSIISDDDIIVRYGGDEFVVAISTKNVATKSAATKNAASKNTANNGAKNTNADGVWYLAEKLRQSIECSTIDIGAECIDITTTIGVTTWRQEEPIDEAILRADNALLQGKKAGRKIMVLMSRFCSWANSTDPGFILTSKAGTKVSNADIGRNKNTTSACDTSASCASFVCNVTLSAKPELTSS